MSEKKNHYRKVFKSDHLGVADLEDLIEEGKKLIFTVAEVKQEYDVTVAGKKGNFNIAYFKEKIKPLVLNATNSKTMKSFSGGSPFVEDWSNKLIELYIDKGVKMKGDVVGGVRISPKQPILQKPELTPDHPRWADACIAFNDGRKESVLKAYTISPANQKLMEI